MESESMDNFIWVWMDQQAVEQVVKVIRLVVQSIDGYGDVLYCLVLSWIVLYYQ